MPDELDWIRVEVNPTSKKVWVGFHSRNDDFLSSLNSITIKDSTGAVLVDNQKINLPKADHPLKVTYVTTQNKFSEAIVHVENYDTKSAHTIQSLEVDGQGVPEASNKKVNPGQHLIFVVKLKTPKTSAALWTVKLVDTDGTQSGWGGLTAKEVYIFEDWPKGDQCPYPNDGANKDNFLKFQCPEILV